MELPDLFPGFATETVDIGAVKLFARIGGSVDAPPLVLLHGYPETHVMWAGIAGELARQFRVVIPDLRGYGMSGIAELEPDSAQMSKRAMAADIVALMARLGHARFALVGHDRGARVGYRLALDFSGKLTRLAVLDIVPTIAMWQGMDAQYGMRAYHWFFLAQPRPLPEMLIAAAPVAYLEHTLASWTAGKSLEAFAPAALEHYRAAFLQPERIAATCEDYRAGWAVDRLLDAADHAAGRTIACPVMALWGGAGFPAERTGAAGEEASPLSIWRQWADQVSGHSIDAGHFVVEENRQETLDRLMPFLHAPA
ncbi:MAG: alpha/beta hydrolase [Ancalomicrobiaceae bacterium]|nr:alpha/beta hydrolase [Ancalomicrobiaceae bacterium]